MPRGSGVANRPVPPKKQASEKKGLTAAAVLLIDAVLSVSTSKTRRSKRRWEDTRSHP